MTVGRHLAAPDGIWYSRNYAIFDSVAEMTRCRVADSIPAVFLMALVVAPASSHFGPQIGPVTVPLAIAVVIALSALVSWIVYRPLVIAGRLHRDDLVDDVLGSNVEGHRFVEGLLDNELTPDQMDALIEAVQLVPAVAGGDPGAKMKAKSLVRGVAAQLAVEKENDDPAR